MGIVKNLVKDQKILIQYLRRKNNVPGLVIAIAPGIIGWSLCNKHDRYSKEKAFQIALSRAEKASKLNPAERDYYYYERIPFTLVEIANKVKERSEKYFK